MFKIIFYSFLVYLLYKFIVDLVIPVSRASTQVRNRMREMQEQQQAQQQYRQREEEAVKKETVKKKTDSDYIEFEEV